MSSVAIPSGSAPRPGFFRVLWELIIGCLFTVFALLLPLIGLVYLGVFEWNAPSFRDWPLRGPYPPDGVWAVSADVVCAAVVIVVATVLISGSMEAAIKLPVSRPVVAGVLMVTGAAPFLYARLLPASGPVSLLVAAFLIQRLAIDRLEPRRLRFTWWLLPLAVAAVAGIAVTVGFGLTHPLWSKDAYFDQDHRVYFSLHNAGLANVTVLSISEPARLMLMRRPHVEGAVIRGHQGRSVVLLTRGCPPDDLRVRYRVFGRTVSTRLRLAPQPSASPC